MTARVKVLFASVLLVLPLVTSLAVQRPTFALLLILAPVVAVLAQRSVAYPVALGAIPALVVALLNRDPFPHGLITVFFFGWTGLAVMLALLSNHARLPLSLLGKGTILCSLLFAIELLMRLPASKSPAYGSTKLQLFLLQTLVGLVAGVLISQHRADFERLVSISLLIAGASALLLLWRLSQGQAQSLFDSRFSISTQENPIQLGRQSADGLLFASYVLLAGSGARTRATAIIFAPVLAVSLLAAGSRGPVLGAIVGLLTLLLLLSSDALARRRLFVVALSAVSGIVLATQFVPGQSIQRSFSFLSGNGGGVSSNGRFQLWSEAWHVFNAHPLLGSGTGSFLGYDGLNQYPHNLFLETAAELGFVGIVLLLGFLAATAITLAKAKQQLGNRGRSQVALVGALFVSALVNAMFSGDIPTNGGIWVAAGLGLGLTLRRRDVVATSSVAPGGRFR